MKCRQCLSMHEWDRSTHFVTYINFNCLKICSCYKHVVRMSENRSHNFAIVTSSVTHAQEWSFDFTNDRVRRYIAINKHQIPSLVNVKDFRGNRRSFGLKLNILVNPKYSRKLEVKIIQFCYYV